MFKLGKKAENAPAAVAVPAPPSTPPLKALELGRQKGRKPSRFSFFRSENTTTEDGGMLTTRGGRRSTMFGVKRAEELEDKPLVTQSSPAHVMRKATSMSDVSKPRKPIAADEPSPTPLPPATTTTARHPERQQNHVNDLSKPPRANYTRAVTLMESRTTTAPRTRIMSDCVQTQSSNLLANDCSAAKKRFGSKDSAAFQLKNVSEDLSCPPIVTLNLAATASPTFSSSTASPTCGTTAASPTFSISTAASPTCSSTDTSPTCSTIAASPTSTTDISPTCSTIAASPTCSASPSSSTATVSPTSSSTTAGSPRDTLSGAESPASPPPTQSGRPGLVVACPNRAATVDTCCCGNPRKRVSVTFSVDKLSEESLVVSGDNKDDSQLSQKVDGEELVSPRKHTAMKACPGFGGDGTSEIKKALAIRRQLTEVRECVFE